MDELEPIKRKIYEIRGQRVMLDRDLAQLYHVKTGNLNKAVKRNIRRFPPDFMFQLTKEEFVKLKNDLIFQNGISSWGGTRKLPLAFTEQGLAMLSGVLNSDIAIDVNISIMRAFVAIRRMAATLPLPNTAADVAQLRKDFEELKLDIEDILRDQNDINEDTRMQLDAISVALAELQSKEPRQKKSRPIGFIQKEGEK
ncbi:MAG: ORF6N domain-containing protein [Bacteroidaceae bacterium]|nr:ORF6N domain-containing protein [Bacteroidaceae bacterium]